MKFAQQHSHIPRFSDICVVDVRVYLNIYNICHAHPLEYVVLHRISGVNALITTEND